ncbi:Glycosyltransferase involved in cell wall bisynthesis [Reichenbachiella faecimaris]|uniref:Glycosyltransferase involved in cell wall bisynthesis n=1 Tax=Reichenbachiella faecimaris TaxID=692418 RepID=A0A1W2GJQ2_REIFA|nr:glycosyltransferase family 2 protein [Reichenbachiella faecimaris]SMD36486.1 Glycosyltransferase involved in cell wall bisynthesis [Reichenbachiella faecimaris]
MDTTALSFSNRPVLSVILPAYNAQHYIREAIDSILDQSFQNFELIVSDDGSSDQTRSIIESYDDPRIVVSHNNKNIGKTETVNRLFGMVKGEFLTIHDADDFSNRERFKKQIDFLKSNPEYGVCGTGFKTITEKGEEFDKVLMNQTDQEIRENIDKHSQIHGPTAVVRTRLIDPKLRIYRAYFENNYEDIDFVYRILSISKAYNLREYLYYYRILPNSLCRKKITIKNRNLYKIVLHLTHQRNQKGIDDLMENNLYELNAKFQKITNHYHLDPSLINREAAAYYMYWNLKDKAIIESIKAIYKKPLLGKNYRTLIYCLRKFFT